MAKKYIDAEKLRAEIERLQHLNECYKRNWRWKFKWFSRTVIGRMEVLEGIKNFINSYQQEQPEKYIELNGIKYRKVPAKTNDKICKDCDYFLDNGMCKLVDCCPCVDDDTILERLQEQPEVDIEKEYTEFVVSDPVYSKLVNGIVGKSIARHFYELGLKARKENQ